MSATRCGGVVVGLLGGFAVADDDTTVVLPIDAQRLIALLALQGPTLPRPVIAGTLWLDATQERASGSLRSALWRIRRFSDHLIEADKHTVTLNPDVTTDITTVTATAHRLRTTTPTLDDLPTNLDPFTRELLPGWYDDWTILERERLRQQSLHTLEAIANHLTTHHRYGAAIDAAIAAISIDPYRETAHRTLITIHLKEGNPTEALRHYHTYRTMLHTELGLEPTPHLTQLLNVAPKVRERFGNVARRRVGPPA